MLCMRINFEAQENVLLQWLKYHCIYKNFSRFHNHGRRLSNINAKEERFNKILIANRGEIACRIIRTCRKLGIKTVSIHSDIDFNALHVQESDESYCVGPALSQQSYLNMERILQAIKESGAEAVHPGYGFLSENTDFALLLEENEITFIGPNVKAIRAMGDKIESKKIAKSASVNTIPGFDGVVSSVEECIEISRSIGYPVMIKASAGGGGKGMRIAYNDNEVREGFRLSSQEAASSFGDDRLLVEKFIECPRHIEIQILCDKHGDGVYLNERECSIQRRNQKVIEEAPSTFIDEGLRKEMGKQALLLANAVGYDSAGTVEFLLDKNRNFYFLEMNTRLQVEHPITECITDIDLVHQMIRIAKGHRLGFRQEDVSLNGWAIESRVYAEDPFKNYGLPSTGRLKKYIEPTYIPNVRCDSGIAEGSEISIYYDPLICKLVTYGPDRQSAINTMIQALDSYVIRGVTHNIALLRDIMTEKRFNDGDLSTNYLKQVYPNGFQGKKLSSKQVLNVCAFASAIYIKDSIKSHKIINSKVQPSNLIDKIKEWNIVCVLKPTPSEKQCSISIKLEIVDHNFKVNVGNEIIVISQDISLASSKFNIVSNNEKITIQLISIDRTGRVRLQYLGTIFEVHVMSEITWDYYRLMPSIVTKDMINVLKSPMPGVIKSISCKVGDLVTEGQELCIIEAMKMQNSLAIPSSGKIKAIHCQEGDSVEENQVIIELE